MLYLEGGGLRRAGIVRVGRNSQSVSKDALDCTRAKLGFGRRVAHRALRFGLYKRFVLFEAFVQESIVLFANTPPFV